jgi:hypothetical protein
MGIFPFRFFAQTGVFVVYSFSACVYLFPQYCVSANYFKTKQYTKPCNQKNDKTNY